jgi:hypothetical protein
MTKLIVRFATAASRGMMVAKMLCTGRLCVDAGRARACFQRSFLVLLHVYQLRQRHRPHYSDLVRGSMAAYENSLC